ncbi:hypothetical protein GQR58_001770 [Nymphon striatum]|nr:hypothetical protein GQR58_001770 [Nymphon striatum]
MSQNKNSTNDQEIAIRKGRTPLKLALTLTFNLKEKLALFLIQFSKKRAMLQNSANIRSFGFTSDQGIGALLSIELLRKRETNLVIVMTFNHDSKKLTASLGISSGGASYPHEKRIY